MKLLSIQPVTQYGFTLYFLAYTSESPPDDDLEAVQNREWLWQRPYTMLELQHFVQSETERFDLPADGEAGYAGLVITGAAQEENRVDPGGGKVELHR